MTLRPNFGTHPTELRSESALVPLVAPHALVVEIDTGSYRAICAYLSDMGFSVTVASSGVEAVVEARNNAPSVIFLAVQLPDVTGAELLEWLRANPALRKVPIVAMHSSSEDIPDLSPSGFNARLKKPTTATKIAQAIQDACT